jgi:hypothetical protein
MNRFVEVADLLTSLSITARNCAIAPAQPVCA